MAVDDTHTHTHTTHRLPDPRGGVQRGDSLGGWSSTDGVESFVGRIASTSFSTSTKVSTFLEVVVLLNNATVYGIYRCKVNTVSEGGGDNESTSTKSSGITGV